MLPTPLIPKSTWKRLHRLKTSDEDEAWLLGKIGKEAEEESERCRVGRR